MVPTRDISKNKNIKNYKPEAGRGAREALGMLFLVTDGFFGSAETCGPECDELDLNVVLSRVSCDIEVLQIVIRRKKKKRQQFSSTLW